MYIFYIISNASNMTKLLANHSAELIQLWWREKATEIELSARLFLKLFTSKIDNAFDEPNVYIKKIVQNQNICTIVCSKFSNILGFDDKMYYNNDI